MERYSMDLRKRVVEACDARWGTRQQVADRFGVSCSWVKRLLQRRRQLGHYGPLTTKPGRKPIFVGSLAQQLEKLVLEQPDVTLEELRDRTGVNCSLAAICKTLQRLDYHRKKRRCGPLSKIDRASSVSVSNGGPKQPTLIPHCSSSSTKAEPRRT
jgi:transposase